MVAALAFALAVGLHLPGRIGHSGTGEYAAVALGGIAFLAVTDSRVRLAGPVRVLDERAVLHTDRVVPIVA